MKKKINLKLLKTTAELSEFITASDSRLSLQIIYPILLNYLPKKPKEGEQNPIINFSFIECLLFIFYQMGKKAPGSLNGICGIKIITGQPQDQDLGDYKEKFEILNNLLLFLNEQTENYLKALSLIKEEIIVENSSLEEKKKIEDKKIKKQLV